MCAANLNRRDISPAAVLNRRQHILPVFLESFEKVLVLFACRIQLRVHAFEFLDKRWNRSTRLNSCEQVVYLFFQLGYCGTKRFSITRPSRAFSLIFSPGHIYYSFSEVRKPIQLGN